jgi:small subunit ribosomal protein S5
MKEKEIIEDITEEVAGTLLPRSGKVPEHGEGFLSADSALKTTSKDLRENAKEVLRKTAKPAQRAKREEVAVGEIASKLICVNRITKVVKGGRTLRFNAVVVAGDKNGRVAVGSGKAREVTEAIRKAEQDAKKQFRTFPIIGTTLPHEVMGHFGTSKVKMLPAKEGHGLVAGVSVRAVLELAGYKDVTAKCYGSTNPINVVKATMDALLQLRTKEETAHLRGKDVV